MKKYVFSAIIFLFTCSLFAFVLPDGTDARISDIKFDNDIITEIVLSESTYLNTSFGKIKASGRVSYYTNGVIKSVFPSEDCILITPIGEFVGSSYETITFYESGALDVITLSEPAVVTINDEIYKIKSGLLSLYDDWKPSFFELREEKPLSFDFGNVVLASNTFVWFFNDGNIATFVVNGPTEITTPVGKIIANGTIGLWLDLKIMYVDVLKTDGLDSKYGKIYPVSNTSVTFYPETGSIKEVIPQDIMICAINDFQIMTKSNVKTTFDKQGNITSGFIKNMNLKYKDWNISFYENNNQFIIYEGNKLYLPYGLIKDVNGQEYEKQLTRFLFLDDCYFSWSPEVDNGNYSSIFITLKDNMKSKLFKRVEGAISHFSKDAKISIYDCPLIFNDENILIGYRKAETKKSTFNEYWDTWDYKSYYNTTTDEYVNYTEDILFEKF